MLNFKRTKNNNILNFCKAAKITQDWNNALFTGNGKIGLSMLGGAGTDKIMITLKDALWKGHIGVLPDVSDKIKQVRAEYNAKIPTSAQMVIPNALSAKGYKPSISVPLPIADLIVKTGMDSVVNDYVRSVNMETSELGVSFKCGNTRFERRLFVSREDDSVILELSKIGPASLNAEFSLDAHDRKCGIYIDEGKQLPENLNIKYENGFMLYSARTDDGKEFGMVSRIFVSGGTINHSPSGISVSSAERIIVVSRVFFDTAYEKEWKKLRAMLLNFKPSYDKLLKGHAVLHQKVFNQSDFELYTDEHEDFVENLISFYNEKNSRLIISKLFKHARFLSACCASENILPIGESGLWCSDYKNENASFNMLGFLQSFYNNELINGNEQSLLAVFSYFEKYMDDLKKNSIRLFNSRGIMIPAFVAHDSGLPASLDFVNFCFMAGSGSIANMFYDYYLYTGDAKFAKTRALPFMREAINFYLTFIQIDKNKNLLLCPGLSPYGYPYGFNEMVIVKNCTSDFAVIKALLVNIISLAKEFSMYSDEIGDWSKFCEYLPEYKTNIDGSISEFMNIELKDNHQTPSFWHLYPVWGSGEVGIYSLPDVKKSFAFSVRNKLENGMGFQTALSLGQFAYTLALLGDGDEAFNCISYIIKSVLSGNLVTTNKDEYGMGICAEDENTGINIVGNTLINSAIAAMFVSSEDSNIFVLPAVPIDWRAGRISGIRTKNGVIVDIDFDLKRGNVIIKLKSRRAVDVNLVFPDYIKKVKGYSVVNNFSVAVSLTANKVTVIEAKM